MAAPLVHGRPARYARTLLRRQHLRAVAGAGAGASATGILIGGVGGRAGQLVAIALLTVCGVVTQQYQKRRGQLVSGIRSEQRVARLLRRSGAAAVINGADLGRGGDADHVVLGPCVAAIETKTGRGRLQVTDRGLQVGRKILPGHPLRQARRQADALTQLIKSPADAVLCIVDLEGSPRRIDGVTICAARDLLEVLSRLDRRISHRDAVTIGKTIPLAD